MLPWFETAQGRLLTMRLVVLFDVISADAADSTASLVVIWLLHNLSSQQTTHEADA